MSEEKDGIAASIVRLTGCSGDVDVAMRKGRVITIFDLEVSLEFNGFLVLSEIRPSKGFRQGFRRSRRFRIHNHPGGFS